MKDPLACLRAIGRFSTRIGVVCAGLMAVAGTVAAQEAPANPAAAAAPAGNSEAEKEKTSQYTKNVSPSGLALGVLSSRVDGGGLPEEVKKLAEEGALASAENPPNWKKAREAYLKMVQAAPRNALAYANLGVVEYRLENFEAARAALNRSLDLNPGIAQNWLTLGLTYHKEGNYELAISSLARALHEDPKDPRTHLYMAIVVRDYGWGTAAETELLRAIKLDPTYADAHFNLALMYLEKVPAAVELARRHYFYAIDLGSKRDEELEKKLARKLESAAKESAAQTESSSNP